MISAIKSVMILTGSFTAFRHTVLLSTLFPNGLIGGYHDDLTYSRGACVCWAMLRLAVTSAPLRELQVMRLHFYDSSDSSDHIWDQSNVRHHSNTDYLLVFNPPSFDCL